jgi:hypothetical protein
MVAHAGGSIMLYRRVDKVADAGHKHSRYERLCHQEQDAGVKIEPLRGVTDLVRSEIDEAIEITTSGYTLKVVQCVESV